MGSQVIFRAARCPVGAGRGANQATLTLSCLPAYTYELGQRADRGLGARLSDCPQVAESSPMKTERRHELQTNELANWLSEWIDTIRPYSKALVAAVLLVTTAWFAVAFTRNRGQQQQAQAWSAFFQAYEQGAESDRLAEVAETYPDSAAGLWALQSAADVDLAQGTQDLFRDRTQAKEALDQAKNAYQQVSEQAADPLLKQRAVFGMAQALESLGQFGPAEDKYREVAETWPESGVSELARQRLQQLERPATQEWYAWFAEQEPAPSPLADPSLFNDLPQLPDRPDLSLPQPGQMLKLPADDPTPSGQGETGSLPLKLDLDESLPAELDALSPAEGAATPADDSAAVPAEDVSPAAEAAPAPPDPAATDDGPTEETPPDLPEADPSDTTPPASDAADSP